MVFELPGYYEKDISVIAKGKELEIIANKFNGENIQDYLHQKLRQRLHFKKQLPDFINAKSCHHTMRNGILEIVFNKSNGRNRYG